MIDLINTKCHDIRHRLAQYRIHPDAITCEELAQLEKGISIYDCTIKTGNETLDVNLTERSLLCQKMGITFSCIVDAAVWMLFHRGTFTHYSAMLWTTRLKPWCSCRRKQTG